MAEIFIRRDVTRVVDIIRVAFEEYRGRIEYADRMAVEATGG